MKIQIAVIGDFKPTNATHIATNEAIAHAADGLGVRAESLWIPTLQIERAGVNVLRSFHGLWCSPGSPYASMTGALAAIRFAREMNRPFFAT